MTRVLKRVVAGVYEGGHTRGFSTGTVKKPIRPHFGRVTCRHEDGTKSNHGERDIAGLAAFSHIVQYVC